VGTNVGLGLEIVGEGQLMVDGRDDHARRMVNVLRTR
jgi:hypothetical protein